MVKVPVEGGICVDFSFFCKVQWPAIIISQHHKTPSTTVASEITATRGIHVITVYKF